MLQYQVDRDKQMETQAFFANMSDEMIANEFPDGVKKMHVGMLSLMERMDSRGCR